ncbi:MAG TPA: DUF4412 domain-containing protein [Syntrophobacteraceae bacterium]|nr:DUF4412 domain-containing protein [Syntrophobacteraceae bacterium]
MRKQRFRGFMTLLGMFVLAWALADPALADIFMKQKQHTDGFTMMGQTQPPKDTVQTLWMSADKLRSDDDKHSVLILLDKQTVYLIDHARKTYQEVPMDPGKMAAEAMGDDEDMTPEEKQQLMNMARGMMKMEVTVVETGEKKKIGNWNCKKYLQTVNTMMGPMTSEIWATEDLKVDYSLYARFSAAMLAMQPGMGKNFNNLAEEMKKIRGVPVLTTTTTKVMNSTMKSSQELLEFKDAKAPQGTFDLPRGYTKQAMGGGAGGPGMRRP